MIPPASLGTDASADPSGLGGASGPRPVAAAERRFHFELAAHPGAVARARQLTRARLAGWAVCEDTCDTAVLVVSELVTNAIVHTAGEHVVCELHAEDDLVRIAVRDEGCAPGEPRPARQRPDEEHGRGLLLVAALCRAWGAQEAGPGLLVWAELAHEADRSAPARLPRPTQSSRDLSCSGGRSRAREETTRPDPSREGAIARSDPGWSAKKPPADGGAHFDLGWSAERLPANGPGCKTEPSLGTETAWV
ncbi:ATP-binding protein [Streptomyces sp. Ru72]|uniref:ATP-binding protein n=1 Tax=Streptomyces sp. Ru72 TaxID=2080747 RepID=UPI0035BE87B6